MKVRISKAHVRIYRAIEGAVRNTLDGHPPRLHAHRTVTVMGASAGRRESDSCNINGLRVDFFGSALAVSKIPPDKAVE